MRVYALEARQMLEAFPETGQRRAKWFEPEKAAGRVAEHELADLIRSFDPDAAPAEPEGTGHGRRTATIGIAAMSSFAR